MISNNDLYKQILGIELPWEITEVVIDIDNLEVNITLNYKSKKGICPECGLEDYIYDKREKRKWRHLDSCQLKTILIASVPRVKCKEHGVKTIEVPWAEALSHFTILFEQHAISLLQATINQTKVADLLRISYSQTHNIMEKAVERGLKIREKSQAKYLGIDGLCSAKTSNSFTLHPSGDIYKCVWEAGVEEYKECTIFEPDLLQTYFNKELYMDCINKKCCFLPLFQTGCPFKTKLRSKELNGNNYLRKQYKDINKKFIIANKDKDSYE